MKKAKKLFLLIMLTSGLCSAQGIHNESFIQVGGVITKFNPVGRELFEHPYHRSLGPITKFQPRSTITRIETLSGQEILLAGSEIDRDYCVKLTQEELATTFAPEVEAARKKFEEATAERIRREKAQREESSRIREAAATLQQQSPRRKVERSASSYENAPTALPASVETSPTSGGLGGVGSAAFAGLAGVWFLIVIFVSIFAILWFFVPFMILGTNRRLNKVIKLMDAQVKWQEYMSNQIKSPSAVNRQSCRRKRSLAGPRRGIQGWERVGTSGIECGGAK